MKYFTKEVKIGLTGAIAIAALFIGLNFLKGINLFKSTNSYYIVFSDIKGLAKSSPVMANGYGIGIVHDIQYDYRHPGHILVEVSVDDGMTIPKGTKAKLVTEMLGGCNLNLVLPDNADNVYAPGDTIQGDDTGGLMDKAADIVPQVEQVIGKVDTLLTTLNAVAGDPNLPAIMENAKNITANLDESSRRLNHLLGSDMPALTGKIGQIGDNVITLTDNLNQLDLQSTLGKADTTLNYLQLMTEKMNRKDNTLGLLLNDSMLYNNLTHTAGSADSLLIDLKETPKRYVHFSLFGRKN
ncbi:MAG: MlaD family protein [Paraprevotella sp.]|nr:MlaD family protein [Paraprevotella sp.]